MDGCDAWFDLPVPVTSGPKTHHGGPYGQEELFAFRHGDQLAPSQAYMQQYDTLTAEKDGALSLTVTWQATIALPRGCLIVDTAGSGRL